MTPSPPAAWYPDPEHADQLRYWDGQHWTEHRTPRSAQQTAVVPEPAKPVAPAAPSAPPSPRIGLFGARAAAKDLAAENAELRSALDRLGGMSLLEVQREVADAEARLAELVTQAARVREESSTAAATARAELASLQARVLDVRLALDVQEVGLYDFEHPAEDSAVLADQLSALRAKIKQTVAAGRAISAVTNFTFNGSTAKGTQFVKGLSKTMLAAYNAEAENAIKTVRAGGLNTARARLDRIVAQVARNGQMIDLHIEPGYHQLRLHELTLAAKHQDAVKAERDAERERRAELREQKRAEDELRRERERLEKERDHYANAAAALRARGDVSGAEELEAKIADVDRAITDVDYRTANIRAGYVYVISNIGAFGERMVKIGMTRRLDPMDRVRELGDASVPFTFDVHALFFSDDAVGVEALLHRHFAEQRVNRVNSRREFFYCTPDDVLHALREHDVAVVEYRTTADADEYRLSQRLAEAAPA